MAVLNLNPTLNSVIPGFSGSTAQASSIIKELMAGKMSTGERKAIYNAGAERGTLNGMPGSSAMGGSLFANDDLRNIGLQSGQRQQQGIQDLLALLQGVSGTVVPTAGQQLADNQFNQNLNFQTTNANRNFGLQQNEQDLNAAKFNEVYGPKETSTATRTGPNGSYVYSSPPVYTTPGGRNSTNASSLMFKYRR